MSEKVNIISSTCDQVNSIIAHAEKKYPENMWMFEVQKAYWEAVRDAHKNGKKVIFFGGAVPIELFYAFDIVPFFLDMLPTRIASTPEVAAKYIDAAEQYVSPSMCGIDKVELGAALCGDYGVQPDAFVYTTVPCDSSRLAYPAIEELWGIPTYTLDTPFRKDARGYQYMADQYDGLIEFFEDLTGTKLNMDKLVEVMEESNRAYEYLEKIADLRKVKPCPLPGRLLVLNEMIAVFAGHPAMTKYMKAQYEVGQYMVSKGRGAVKEEKYRVSWLQNMLWSNVGTIDWMEKEFGAVLVMDGFGYQKGVLFEDLQDMEEIKRTLAKKAMAVPMIHGASGPAENFVQLINDIMVDYDVNVSMFVGHVGCKHTWAAAKIVTDMVQEKFGIPTLNMDIDAIDGRYKTTEEIRATITEYMETIEANKNA